MRNSVDISETVIVRHGGEFDISILVAHGCGDRRFEAIPLDSLKWNDVSDGSDKRKTYKITLGEIEKQVRQYEDEYLDLFVWRDTIACGKIYRYNNVSGWYIYAITLGQAGG